MYFYIVKTKTDIGFGITGDYEKRAQDYVSHSGPNSGIYFPIVLTGYTPHIKKIESIIKHQWIDRTYVSRDGWKTEWLRENESVDDFFNDIMMVIKERHLRIQLHTRDYNFLDPL